MARYVLVLSLFLFGEARGEEFSQEFRNAAAVPPTLSYFGGDLEQAVKREPEGLRLTLRGAAGENDLGVTPRFQIRGDFEITVRYEVLSINKPAAGNGAGFKLWGQIGTKDFQGMTLAYLLRPDGKQGVMAIFSQVGRGGKRAFQVKSRETEVRQGRFRLVRKRSELVFMEADSDASEFREIHRAAVAKDPVTALRVAVVSGESSAGVSARLIDLQIRADGLSGAGGSRSGGGGGWFVLAVLLVVVAGGGVVIWRTGWWKRWLGRTEDDEE